MLIRSLAFAAVLVSFIEPLFAQQPAFDDARLAKIPERMEQFVKDGQISGAVTLVATKDRVVHLAAVGKADLATSRSMEPDAIFRVASMTKPITSTALMMLIEQGKLAVDDPVAKHIPAFAGQKLKDGTVARPVTIRDIVTHTAGLAYDTTQPGDGPYTRLRVSGGLDQPGLSMEENLARITAAGLMFQPGAKWLYSVAIDVLGAAM